MPSNTKVQHCPMLSEKRSKQIILCLLTHFGPMTRDEIYLGGLYMGNDGHRRKTLSIEPIPKRWPTLYGLYDLFGHGVMSLVDLQKDGLIRLCDGIDRWEIITPVEIEPDDLDRLHQVERCNWKLQRRY